MQPGKTGAVADPELESSSASGQGNVTSVGQLKKPLLWHQSGVEAFALCILSSFLEDGVGMFEIIITVICDRERRLVPGSARRAAVRALTPTTGLSPVCLPITLKWFPKPYTRWFHFGCTGST